MDKVIEVVAKKEMELELVGINQFAFKMYKECSNFNYKNNQDIENLITYIKYVYKITFDPNKKDEVIARFKKELSPN